ncbi:hypothetical protein GWK48_07875 [Metallosphaera tengchongensis]|uniref:Uncharacterized protein n=1 Tax=Metallosphaera tengchongensis TaxID=1532350 RepID=A0A6N0NTV2_9CREN|nr:hypothetical protein [Metallosphaera tengchongensis]QKR00304.1 hypothetical protein GWK48_07875 [Metallosphaera tengchongensis]
MLLVPYTIFMVLEHFAIGYRSLTKYKTVDRKMGVPLAVAEILYYSLLTLSLGNLALMIPTYLFLITHAVGGAFYIFNGRLTFSKEFFQYYSIYEFIELLFLVTILLAELWFGLP